MKIRGVQGQDYIGHSTVLHDAIITRPEVSKLTPENTKNSQVAKLCPAELRLKHIDRHTETMNSF